MFPTRLKQSLYRAVSSPAGFLLLIPVVGLVAVGTIWLIGLGRNTWLEVLKDNNGVMVGMEVDPQRIPSTLLAQLPTPGDNTPLLDARKIKTLAERYELYQSWESNPTLCFDDGVIAYWSKQGRPAWELELRFLSRRLVLESAERAQARIPSPGDLSYWAERVYPVLFKKAQEK